MKFRMRMVYRLIQFLNMFKLCVVLQLFVMEIISQYKLDKPVPCPHPELNCNSNQTSKENFLGQIYRIK